MQNVLIAGASRGIGLALVHGYLERGDRVYAVIRRPNNAPLQALSEAYPQRLRMIVSDLNDEHASQRIEASLDGPLDISLFNAGVSAGQGIENIGREHIADLFLTNAIAPLRIARQIASRMTADSVLAFMSSQMGSVELARASDMPLYRASKAALNSLLRSWSSAPDHPEACLLALHPGWVKTDMGGDAAPVEIHDSAAGLIATIDSYRGRQGCHFADYQQQALPW